jgi:DNA-binding NarL/FixJ family response regulator
MNELRILIADDHPVVRDGLKTILESDDELHIKVLACKNGKEAIDCVMENHIDLILLDISMPEMDGFEALEILKNDLKIDAPVLMITSHDTAHMVLQSIELGASGYILKNSSAEELMLGVKKALQNQQYYSAEIAQILARNKDNDFPTLFKKLTPREKQIFILILNEKSNQEIATSLSISHRTVEGHRERLLSKMNVTSTIGLVKLALNNGFDV